MLATASSDQRALKAKMRAIQRLLIKAYGEPPRPAWAGTVRPLDQAEAATQWDPIDPLDELINTILSQNTNDLNRDRAYHALRLSSPHGKRCAMRPAGKTSPRSNRRDWPIKKGRAFRKCCAG